MFSFLMEFDVKYEPFKDETVAVWFKDPVPTAQ